MGGIQSIVVTAILVALVALVVWKVMRTRKFNKLLKQELRLVENATRAPRLPGDPPSARSGDGPAVSASPAPAAASEAPGAPPQPTARLPTTLPDELPKYGRPPMVNHGAVGLAEAANDSPPVISAAMVPDSQPQRPPEPQPQRPPHPLPQPQAQGQPEPLPAAGQAPPQVSVVHLQVGSRPHPSSTVDGLPRIEQLPSPEPVAAVNDAARLLQSFGLDEDESPALASASPAGETGYLRHSRRPAPAAGPAGALPVISEAAEDDEWEDEPESTPKAPEPVAAATA